MPGRTVVIGSLEVVPTGRMVTHPDEHLLPRATARCAPAARRRVAARADNRYLDSAAICRGPVRQHDRRQRAHARRRRPGRRGADRPGQSRAGDRAQRRGRAAEHRRLPIRSSVGGRPDCRSRSHANLEVRTPETLDQLVAPPRRPTSPTTRTPTTPRASAHGRRGPRAPSSGVAPGSTGADRHRRPQPAQADGVQGRVRGRPAGVAARVAGAVRGGRRPDTKVTYHLHPPMLRSLGLDRKLKFRRTGEPSFNALRSMKRLRGTLADPFRWAEVRTLERAMIPEYEKALDTLTDGAASRQPRRGGGDRRRCPIRCAATSTSSSTEPTRYRAELAANPRLPRV